jgi:hypothetical protein
LSSSITILIAISTLFFRLAALIMLKMSNPIDTIPNPIAIPLITLVIVLTVSCAAVLAAVVATVASDPNIWVVLSYAVLAELYAATLVGPSWIPITAICAALSAAVNLLAIWTPLAVKVIWGPATAAMPVIQS